MRSALREILSLDEGAYEVEEAADGLEAREKIRLAGCDVLLTDIKMPRMDGHELLKALRVERPRLPVVVISSVRDEESIIACLAEGAWDYILKPFKTDHVRAAVRRASSGAGSLPSGPEALAVVSEGPGALELTAASDEEYLYRFRRFTELLLASNLQPAEREDIRFAIEELGRNAMEWGNRYDHGKRVRLAYRLAPSRIVFEIEDEGEGFLPDALPDPSADHVAHVERRRREGKRPGGYGVYLVRKMMDEVSYSTKGNAVVMTKYLR